MTGSVTPGTVGTPNFSALRLEVILSPMASMALAGGPTHTIPASVTLATGHSRIEAVSGVDRLGARVMGDLEDPLLIQVAVGCGRGAGIPGLVGEVDMKGIAIQFRIHGDGANSHLSGRADHPDGDLAAIGDEEAFHH